MANDAGMEETRLRKKRFYDEMESLLNSDDDVPDPGREASEAEWKRCIKKTAVSTLTPATMKAPVPTKITVSPKAPVPGKTPISALKAPASLARSLSDGNVEMRARPSPSQLHGKSTSTDPSKQVPKKPITLRKSATVFPTSSFPSSAPNKRKSAEILPAVPDDQKIFEGLHFFFFPNTDTNPARRMRIVKARQYGAEWHKDWSEEVTHVILDKNIGFAQLIKFLRFEKLPDHVAVVPENYPAECLSYSSILDHKQARFAVSGFTPPALKHVDSTNSDKSLQLKPARGTTKGQPRETPPDETVTEVAASVVASSVLNLEETADRTDRVVDSFSHTEPDTNHELEEAIQRARALQDIPLDEDREDDRPISADGLDSGDEGQPQKDRRKNKLSRMQDKFSCMQKNVGDKGDNPNQATIDILQQMADHYGQTGDEWRIRAYRKAMSSLRTHPTKVTTKEEAAALPNIGDRLAEKIEEIAMTNRLRRLDNAKAEPTDTALQTFMGVYGAGIVQATRWVDEGYKTLDELLAKAKLTDNQRIGIEHYEDFNTRIPRSEVERHGNVVRAALQAIDPAFKIIVGGSYRRGSKDSGDIDCIITHPTANSDHIRNLILGQLVPQLIEKGFLVASLAITSKDDGSKWHGASCLPGSTTWRRLDLLLVPPDELGAALIYFTGNNIFNRSLRLLASTKGMRLNQRGLYRDVLRGPRRAKLTDGTLVEGRDEKRIFEHLGVPWRPPEHRIC